MGNKGENGGDPQQVPSVACGDLLQPLSTVKCTKQPSPPGDDSWMVPTPEGGAQVGTGPGADNIKCCTLKKTLPDLQKMAFCSKQNFKNGIGPGSKGCVLATATS